MLNVFGKLMMVIILGILAGCGSHSSTSSSKTLQSIAVTPTNSSIAKGTSQQFIATGIYSDNSTQDLTTQVTWSSSDETKATVGYAAGTYCKATSLAAGTTTITAASGLISGSTTLTVTAATLASIAVTPTTPSIAKGTSQQFVATGVYSDNSTQDLTPQVTWSSSDTTIATISNADGTNGKANSLAAGTTTITAASGPISASTTLTVTAATLSSIVVTPTNPSIAKGTSQQFVATGIYSDNSTQDLTPQVTWSSSDMTRATVSNADGTNGKATSKAAGTTTIMAASGLISGSTTLTVTAATLASIAVTPTDPSIARGTSQQFVATGTYSDNSTQDLTPAVTWSSSDMTRATISNAAGTNGKATSLAAGTTTITAAAGLISGSTTLTVTVTVSTLSSIAVTPVNPGISANPGGTTLQFKAIGTYTDNSTLDLTTAVTWGSTDVTKATISNVAGSNGKATTVAAGLTTIMATMGTVSGATTLTVNNAALVSITVLPDNPQILVGGTVQCNAIGNYNDASTQNLTSLVSWTSSNSSIAAVITSAGSKGLVAGFAGGSATITATSGSIHGSTEIEVESP